MRQPDPLPQDVAEVLERGATHVEPPAHVRARLRERLSIALAGPIALLHPPATTWGRLAAAASHSRTVFGLAGIMVGAATIWALRTPAPSEPSHISPTIVAPAAEVTSAPSSALPAPQAAAAPVPAPSPRPTVGAMAASLKPALVKPARLHLDMAVAERPAAPALAPMAPLVAPASPQNHTGLQAEGDLLQKGRTAMVRGDPEGALTAVEEHTSRFPHGKLAEEREALKIQALVAQDRTPEARAALGTFQHEYPQSLLGPALEEAVVGRIR